MLTVLEGIVNAAASKSGENKFDHQIKTPNGYSAVRGTKWIMAFQQARHVDLCAERHRRDRLPHGGVPPVMVNTGQWGSIDAAGLLSGAAHDAGTPEAGAGRDIRHGHEQRRHRPRRATPSIPLPTDHAQASAPAETADPGQQRQSGREAEAASPVAGMAAAASRPAQPMSVGQARPGFLLGAGARAWSASPAYSARMVSMEPGRMRRTSTYVLGLHAVLDQQARRHRPTVRPNPRIAVHGEPPPPPASAVRLFSPVVSRASHSLTGNAEIAGSGRCSQKLRRARRLVLEPFRIVPIYATSSSSCISVTSALRAEGRDRVDIRFEVVEGRGERSAASTDVPGSSKARSRQHRPEAH